MYSFDAGALPSKPSNHSTHSICFFPNPASAARCARAFLPSKKHQPNVVSPPSDFQTLRYTNDRKTQGLSANQKATSGTRAPSICRMEDVATEAS
jgi:hypothetical protein